MKVKDLGEFSLIDRLASKIREAGLDGPDSQALFPLLVGIGDDTAAWKSQRQIIEFSTTDTVVEGVHFTTSTTPWKDLGWKVMAANLSDIAAMGGTPLYALVTLGLPEDTLVTDIDALYDGMLWACKEYGAMIAGGDIVRSPVPFVTVALNGYSDHEPLTRSAARVGDLIATTGPLGASRAGLELLLNNVQVSSECADYLRGAHRHPLPRVAEGRILAHEGVLAAMDISDGLVDDLGKFMAASGLAAKVESWKVPIHPLLKEAFPQQALDMALAGGEDYELLYIAPSPVMERTLQRIPGAAIIGHVVEGKPGEVQVIREDGAVRPVGKLGWDHFRS